MKLINLGSDNVRNLVIGICSVGSGVGQAIIESSQYFRDDVTLIGLGNNPLAYGAFDCDDYTVIPSYYDIDYIPQVEAAVKDFGIDILIPGHDDEALLLASNKEALSKRGVTILSSPAELILMCRKKAQYVEAFYEAADYFVRTYKRQDLCEEHFPVIAKPETGFSSNGVIVISSNEEMKSLRLAHDYIYQEIAAPSQTDPHASTFAAYIENGENLQRSEISLQLIFDWDSRVVNQCATVNALKSGVPVEVTPYPTSELSDFIGKLSLSLQRLGAFGPINVQGRMTDRGFKAFEINPRFTGITGLRAKLGYNEVEFCIFALVAGQRAKPLVLSDRYLGVSQIAHKKIKKTRIKSDHDNKFQQRNILLTGSRGMVGRSLYHQLINLGHEVDCVQTQKTSKTGDQIIFGIEDLLEGVVNFSSYDAIIHLGFSRPYSFDEEIYTSVINSFELVTQAAQNAVDRFIFASSQSVYGFSEEEEEYCETSVTNPVDRYAQGKMAVERHIKSVSKLNPETRFTVLRLSSIMAPFESNLRHEKFSLMISELLNNKTVTITSPTRKISKIDLRDVVSGLAHFTSLDTGGSYDVINIAPERTLSVSESIGMAACALGKKEKVVSLGGIESPSPGNLIVSSRKAERKYGWRAEKTIDQTAKYFERFLVSK